MQQSLPLSSRPLRVDLFGELGSVISRALYLEIYLKMAAMITVLVPLVVLLAIGQSGKKITSCKKNHRSQGNNRIYHWHQAGYKPTTSFSSVFGAAPMNAENTLGSVMRVGAGTDSFERHVVAALLSASHPLMASHVPYTVSQVKSAYSTVASNPYSTASLDIIDIFEALFIDHDETDLGAGTITISDQYLAELSIIAGVSSPRVDNVCKSKKK